MNRIFNTLSIVGLLCGLALMASIHYPNINGDAISEAAATPPAPFLSFPVDVARSIEFDLDDHDGSAMTQREKRDESLDWLLFAVLSDAGLSADQLNEVTFDLPASRYGYLRKIANFEFGRTRSRAIGDGRVVALVPGGASEEERNDQLNHVFDEQRKNLGQVPDRLIVFEYEFESDGKDARITRRVDLPGEALLAEQFGYVEAEIRGIQDLNQFLAATDDITFARFGTGGLTIGGRKIQSYKYRGIRTEDVAALWQSEREVSRRTREIEIFEERWRLQTCSTEAECLQLEEQLEREKAELKQRITLDGQTLGAPDHSGFSLDPSYDFAALSSQYELIELVLAEVAVSSGISISDLDMDSARAGLAKRDIDPLLAMFKEFENKGFKEASNLASWILKPFKFQAARYDGELAGTEVGMNLFYTDLLAKLWALDYMNSAPANQVEDFRPLTAVDVSPVFRQELMELTGTRLWFGHNDQGFQMVGDGESLLLARNVTRVYAASSNTLEPGKETEPNAASEAFLGWWNDHYEEVARHEPEYERLNQIMKWSIVLGWLNAAERGESLGFLKDVSVDRSQWFPDWVERHPELRFRDWTRVGFHGRNYLGASSETMPILSSQTYDRFGEDMILTGGVSLVPKQVIKERFPLKPTINQTLRRSNLNYARVDPAGRSYQTLGETTYTTYKMNAPRAGQAGLTAQANLIVDKASGKTKPARLRTRTGELGAKSIERSIVQSKGGLVVQTGAGGKRLGSLNIAKSTNGFSIGWRGREIDAGQALARRAGRAPDLLTALRSDPEVQAVLQLSEQQQYVVKLRGTERWLRIAPETKPSSSLPEGWDARVADFAGARKNLQLAWIEDPRSLVAGLGDDGYLVVDSSGKNGSPLLRLETAPSTPSAAGQSVTFWDSGTSIVGVAAPDRSTVRVRWGELRAKASGDPLQLADRIARARIGLPEESAGAAPLRVALPHGREAIDSPLIIGLRSNDAPAVARSIAKDPAGAARQLQDHLQQGLVDVESLMAEGRYLRAVNELDALIEIHGPNPDLTLRKGVAQIQRGRMSRGLEAINQAQSRPLRDQKAFFQEIDARLQNAVTESERQRLSRVADVVQWHEQHARTPKGGERLFAEADGDQIRVILHADRLEGQVARAPEIADTDANQALIYVQDSPGLNNLDWSVSVQRALAEIPMGPLPKVVRLTNESIARYRPDKLFIADPTVHFNLANKTHALQPVRTGQGLGGQSCEEDPSGDCRDRRAREPVFLVSVH